MKIINKINQLLNREIGKITEKNVRRYQSPYVISLLVGFFLWFTCLLFGVDFPRIAKILMLAGAFISIGIALFFGYILERSSVPGAAV